eukprot:763034_1
MKESQVVNRCVLAFIKLFKTNTSRFLIFLVLSISEAAILFILPSLLGDNIKMWTANTGTNEFGEDIKCPFKMVWASLWSLIFIDGALCLYLVITMLNLKDDYFIKGELGACFVTTLILFPLANICKYLDLDDT